VSIGTANRIPGGHVSDGEELRHLRKTVVQRLEALETERSDLAQRGRAEEARGILRAFQEVARLLEEIDEILTH
jgi:hypothetical protein